MGGKRDRDRGFDSPTRLMSISVPNVLRGVFFLGIPTLAVILAALA